MCALRDMHIERNGKQSTLHTALLVGWVLAASACGNGQIQNREAAARSCSADQECGSGDLCVFRLCRPGCNDQESCAEGLVCLSTERGGACTRLQDNACAGSDDCPLGTKCAFGRCMSMCASDERCSEGLRCVAGVCQAGETRGASPVNAMPDAAVAASDAQIAQSPPPSAAGETCPPGMVQCRGNSVVRCDANGVAQAPETCPFVCREGACTGLCKPDEHRCDGKLRQSCSAAGEWQLLETCPNLCMPRACADTCKEGNEYCNGTTLMVCRDGRGQEARECPYVCTGGACGGSCAPGSKQCDGNAITSCDASGTWTAAMSCGNGACVSGECRGVCTPGARRCKAGSSQALQVCSNDGAWLDDASCNGQACVSGVCRGVCTPAVKRCSADASGVQTCMSNGTWSNVVPCSGGNRCNAQSARCALESSCESGQSPDWSSSAGANPSLDDPRWDLARAASVERDGLQLGYRIIVDRSAGAPGELVVSMRVLPSDGDIASQGDNVFFGVGVDEAGGEAHSVAIDLGTLEGSDDPRPLMSFNHRDTFGAANGVWSTGTDGPPDWLNDPAAWLDAAGAAWAVNFRVDLGVLFGTQTNALRIALGAHLNRVSVSTDLIASSDATLTYDGLQVALPTTWLHATIAPDTCVANLVLTRAQ